MHEKLRSELPEFPAKRPGWWQQKVEYRFIKSRAYANGLLPKSTGKAKSKFLLLCRPRSGSHLLMSMLQQHTDIHLDDERRVLHKRNFQVRFPALYLTGLSKRSQAKVYIAKTHINRIAVQGCDPEKVLLGLQTQGWKYIYLYRENLLEQAISHLIVARRQIVYDTQKDALQGQKFNLPVTDLKQQIKQGEAKLSQELAIAESIGCLKIEYGQQFSNTKFQEKTLKSVLSYLDVPDMPLHSPIQKTSPRNWREVVQNSDEIEAFIRQSRFSHFLNERGTST